MLAQTELDYIADGEKGYCFDHPAVIAETHIQVVDRAVMQLLTALQSNGFELDGNLLKRGDGWLKYDDTKWQYSNDAGVTWQEMGSGSGGGLPLKVENGAPYMSLDDGVSWITVGDMQKSDYETTPGVVVEAAYASALYMSNRDGLTGDAVLESALKTDKITGDVYLRNNSGIVQVSPDGITWTALTPEQQPE
jgi:hypothetical protein